MNDRSLHIVCLDIPYPADYGGAMEEFYKLKGLHECGIKITLHCFEYGNRRHQPELKKYCEKIVYYSRGRNLSDIFSSLPFIVRSRMNEELLKNLSLDDHPILFDSTHSTGFINHPSLKKRKKIVRLHNIEWIYYNTLFRSAFGWFERLYFFTEYKKLRKYDSVLEAADLLLCLSQTDHEYYKEKFPSKKVELIYVFHENENIMTKEGKGNYLLYHGNLSVLDNYMAVIETLNKLEDCPHKIIIAGKEPDQALIDAVKNKKNVELVSNPSFEQLVELILEAHICLAVARNPSGIKLKLINSMYRGRFIFSNENAFEGSGLESCVVNVDEHPDVLLKVIDEYMKTSFDLLQLEERKKVLAEKYDNRKNAERIVHLIFGEANQ